MTELQESCLAVQDLKAWQPAARSWLEDHVTKRTGSYRRMGSALVVVLQREGKIGQEEMTLGLDGTG